MKIKGYLKILSLSYRNKGFKGIFNLAKVFSDLFFEPETVSSRITSAKIEVTTRCNLKCRFCDNTVSSRRKTDMQIHEFLQILEKMPFLSKISLSGVGEPFLNPNIFQFIRLAKERHIFIGTFTNATLLSEDKIDRLIRSDIDWLNISLDGATKETYETIRRGAVFENVISNTGMFQDKNIRNGEKIDVAVWMTLTKSNIGELPRMIPLLKSLKIKKLNIQSLHPWGKDYWKKELGDYQVEYENKGDFLSETAERAGKEGILLNYSTAGSKSRKRRTCNWPWRSCNITVDGFITPCCMNGSDPEIINFGNIYRQSFEEIWNSRDYRFFRKQLKSSSMPDICRGCPGYFYVGF
ncbi:radical SAM protein [bacterium]|jgi:pyrroloquinoline quinone biosynthesis protein E|nr:radical SAM protein [bacterium]